MIRIVADLGNSRLKWGRVGPLGRLEQTVSLPLDDPTAWAICLDDWAGSGTRSSWAISSVNPPLAGALREFLDRLDVVEVRWFTSAADVPVNHALEDARTAGADRALAVLAAQADGSVDRVGPGVVVSCGSAAVVERISSEGVWRGGAITLGLGLSARALNQLTAQLPLVPVEGPPMAAWGDSTRPAMVAGLFWGTVGALREILARQAEGLESRPWVIWTGGEASLLARHVDGPDARVVPDLVLEGLVHLAFPEVGEDLRR